jgi:enamine deaminase RidA (YjgF/YER057c/UK114 family)
MLSKGRVLVRRGSGLGLTPFVGKRFAGTVEGKIKGLGLAMPAHNVPKNAFVNFVQIGNLVYLSGHLPQPAEGALVVGKVGKDVTVEQGYEAAKLVGLNLCATLKANLGDLDKVKRVVKLTAFVNCVDAYAQQPQVANGCSELFVKIFGPEVGAHTRSAVGTNSLPLNVPVEIEAIFEV